MCSKNKFRRHIMAHKIELWHKIETGGPKNTYWKQENAQNHIPESLTHWLKVPRNLALRCLETIGRRKEWSALGFTSFIKKIKDCPPQNPLLFQHRNHSLFFKRSSGTPEDVQALPTSDQAPSASTGWVHAAQRAEKQKPIKNVIPIISHPSKVVYRKHYWV